MADSEQEPAEGVLSRCETIKMQQDYTACLPMNTEINIPKDDPVRLLSEIIERMNLEALFATYSQNRMILGVC